MSYLVSVSNSTHAHARKAVVETAGKARKVMIETAGSAWIGVGEVVGLGLGVARVRVRGRVRGRGRGKGKGRGRACTWKARAAPPRCQSECEIV